MKIMLIGLATLASTLSTAALAQDRSAQDAHNVQCFIVSSALINSADANTKTIGLLSATFFAGQLFGSDPKVDLASMVKTQDSKLTPENEKALMSQCGQELAARGREIDAAGGAMTRAAGAAKP